MDLSVKMEFPKRITHQNHIQRKETTSYDMIRPTVKGDLKRSKMAGKGRKAEALSYHQETRETYLWHLWFKIDPRGGGNEKL